MAISDDIADLLNGTGRIRARRVDRLQFGSDRASFGLRGSVETRDGLLRVNVSLANLSTGETVYWRSLEDERDNILKLTRQVVDVLLEALHIETKDKQPSYVARHKRIT